MRFAGDRRRADDRLKPAPLLDDIYVYFTTICVLSVKKFLSLLVEKKTKYKFHGVEIIL